MTDPEITALACEYAEETFKDDESNPDLSISLLNEIRQECAKDVEEIIRFLLRRYCLVEKSKFQEKYKNARNIQKEIDKPSTQYACNAVISTLEQLFPEIGKEVEE